MEVSNATAEGEDVGRHLLILRARGPHASRFQFHAKPQLGAGTRFCSLCFAMNAHVEWMSNDSLLAPTADPKTVSRHTSMGAPASRTPAADSTWRTFLPCPDWIGGRRTVPPIFTSMTVVSRGHERFSGGRVAVGMPGPVIRSFSEIGCRPEDADRIDLSVLDSLVPNVCQ